MSEEKSSSGYVGNNTLSVKEIKFMINHATTPEQRKIFISLLPSLSKRK
jgi:hypothetical protein